MTRLCDVNTTDLRDAIRLGCRTMASVFNADDPHHAPFFDSSVRPEARLGFSPVFSDAHVPGRHLNALLNAEAAANIAIDEATVTQHAQITWLAYGGPVALPLNRPDIHGEPVNFTPHNIREGFHALYALARYRNSTRAREIAAASIAAIFDYWDPDAGWDIPRLRQAGVRVPDNTGTFISGIARAIGPLVKYYRATGYGPALDLALVLKEKAVTEAFDAAGHYNAEAFGAHTHSITCTMSGLAQLADLTADIDLLHRVKAFYDNGLWEIRDALGWVIELAHAEAPPDRGECNNTGDILETALILGRWGYTAAYADAERILRGHLLPAQLRDISFIEASQNHDAAAVSPSDGLRNVAERHQGAFGFPAPYGHEPVGAIGVQFNMDIVGGAVASLCEAYREVTRRDAAGHRVNLLFDHETDELQVVSPYTHPALQITVKRPAPLFVRVPPWLDAAHVIVAGTDAPPRLTHGYVVFATPPIGTPLTLSFPLVEQTLTLHHRTRDIAVCLRGDEVVAMENFGADLTYFPTLDEA